MTDVKLTAAQRRAAIQIQRGEITCSTLSLSCWNHRLKRYVRRASVQALLDREICVLLPADARDFAQPVALTDLGREVIANG